MLEVDYQKLKAEFEAERHAKIAKADADHRAAMEHLDFVWHRLRSAPSNGNGNGNGTPVTGPITFVIPDSRGGLIQAMKVAIAALDEFSKHDVIAYLNTYYPDLNASEREISITSNLSRMNASGEIEIAAKGLRGKPQRYRKTDKFNASTGVVRGGRKEQE